MKAKIKKSELHTWTKADLKAIRKPRNATHCRLVDEKGRVADQKWDDRTSFEGCTGKLTAGRLRRGEKKGSFFEKIQDIVWTEPAPVPPAAEDPKRIAEKVATDADKKEAAKKDAPKAEKGPGKCEFIDHLFAAGNHTIHQIFTLTMNAFPGGDPEKTLRTVRCRPSHMRKAGANPTWIKERRPTVA